MVRWAEDRCSVLISIGYGGQWSVLTKSACGTCDAHTIQHAESKPPDTANFIYSFNRNSIPLCQNGP
ncbi:hypothetical protein HY17_02125 [Hyphomonas sp. CY54-11-8]|mgnify:CR=1 FL=1|nr:hypothetical protein HY17_02125 [Hyphomonas sp. CY54-11-8]